MNWKRLILEAANKRCTGPSIQQHRVVLPLIILASRELDPNTLAEVCLISVGQDHNGSAREGLARVIEEALHNPDIPPETIQDKIRQLLPEAWEELSEAVFFLSRLRIVLPLTFSIKEEEKELISFGASNFSVWRPFLQFVILFSPAIANLPPDVQSEVVNAMANYWEQASDWQELNRLATLAHSTWRSLYELAKNTEIDLRDAAQMFKSALEKGVGKTVSETAQRIGETLSRELEAKYPIQSRILRELDRDLGNIIHQDYYYLRWGERSGAASASRFFAGLNEIWRDIKKQLQGRRQSR